MGEALNLYAWVVMMEIEERKDKGRQIVSVIGSIYLFLCFLFLFLRKTNLYQDSTQNVRSPPLPSDPMQGKVRFEKYR